MAVSIKKLMFVSSGLFVGACANTGDINFAKVSKFESYKDNKGFQPVAIIPIGENSKELAPRLANAMNDFSLPFLWHPEQLSLETIVDEWLNEDHSLVKDSKNKNDRPIIFLTDSGENKRNDLIKDILGGNEVFGGTKTCFINLITESSQSQKAKVFSNFYGGVADFMIDQVNTSNRTSGGKKIATTALSGMKMLCKFAADHSTKDLGKKDEKKFSLEEQLKKTYLEKIYSFIIFFILLIIIN